jgi:hypothetical protein
VDDREDTSVPPPQIHVFDPSQIARGPDEIRGQVGSCAFIYTKYRDAEGNRWFLRPGYVGHEEMTDSREILLALFGPEADAVHGQVVSIGDVYEMDERGYHVPTGEKRQNWDWYLIRRLAKRQNLFGRVGVLGGRQVVMLWGDPPGWEEMLSEVLRHLGIARESEAIIVVGSDRQYKARDFIPP